MRGSRLIAGVGILGGSIVLARLLPFPSAANAGKDRITAMERELKGIFDEASELAGPDRGGAKAFPDWIRNVKARKNKLEARARGLDDTVEKLGGSIESIDAMRKEMADGWVAGGGDLAGEAAETAVREAIKKRLASEGLKCFLGAASLAIDVVDYGGRQVIKELNVRALQDLVRQQQVTLREVYALQVALLAERDLASQKLEKLEKLKARFDDVFERLAEERQRQEKATRYANKKRETDAAGDAEERKKLADCSRIDCDCDGVDAGLLTGPFRKECRQAESSLKRACSERGKLPGRCHPTASGPKAWPQ
jgi:hypothetical protein